MSTTETVLGIGGSDHDVHSCLIRGGRVVVAIEEERISRKKYGLGGNLLEGHARKYCLEYAGIGMADVDDIYADAILAPTALLSCRKRARRLDHHLAHAATAWFTSGFETGAVLVVDNAGGLVADAGVEGLQATSYFRAGGRKLELVKRVLSKNWHEGPRVAGAVYQRGDGDHSLGHFYKKVSGALGFGYYPANGGAKGGDGFYFPEDGKTMGLASYGDLRFFDDLWKLAELLPGGEYRLALNDGRLDSILRGWLEPEADFDTRAAVAAAAQEVLTRVMCHLVEYLIEVTGERKVCLSGGVAMNSMTNGQLLRRTPVERLYVPPVPGDNGTGIGAALWAVSRKPGAPIPAYSVYSGRPYGPAEVGRALAGLDPEKFSVSEPDAERLLEEVAARLARGEVVGWFEGGSENGRRALGHRSLLADPRDRKMRDHLNYTVKCREPFRPFAPVVIEERASEFFDLPQPSPYMQIVVPVRPRWRDGLGAVTHVDGTARVQTVRLDEHPRLYRLLKSFERESGIPVLLNTSFNGRGEPIVETPEDAVNGLRRMPFDALVLENHLVVRR
jgi:carbamoyltransferase